MEMFTPEKLFLATIGGAMMAKEQMEQAVNQLVNKGELSKEQAKNLVDQATTKAESEKSRLEVRGKEELHKFFADQNLAFVDDIRRLENRIAALEARLEALTPKENAEA